MYKNSCLRTVKYTEIQTASVYGSVRHVHILILAPGECHVGIPVCHLDTAGPAPDVTLAPSCVQAPVCHFYE